MKLDNPSWPFLLVFLLPLIAALASIGILTEMPKCGSDETWWEAKHVRLAFLPGVVGLIPLAWLFSSSLPAKQAGGIAGIMGAAQFALPQASVAYYAAVAEAGSQVGNPSCTVSVFLLPWLVPSIVVLWFGCLIMGAFALRKLTRQIQP